MKASRIFTAIASLWLATTAVAQTAAQQIAPGVVKIENPAAKSDFQHVDERLGREAELLRGLGPLIQGTSTKIVNNGTDVTVGNGSKAIRQIGTPQMVNDTLRAWKIATSPAARWYGAGERGHRAAFAPGDTLVNYNRQNYGYGAGDPRISQMNITMPLLISSDGYAIVFDDFMPSTFVFGTDGTLTYTTENLGPVNYYYVEAEDMPALIQRLSAVTGRQPLPPLWSLGYVTSRYGYRSPQEALGAVDSLKTRGYPVDGLVFDLYWYGKEQDMGRLAWSHEWDYKTMLDSLKRQHVNVVTISQPYILRNGHGLNNYNLLDSLGMMVKNPAGETQEVVIWVGEGGMFDVSNPDTKAWLRERYRQLALDGDGALTGWWGDLGEPEVHPYPGRHANGLTARQYHNQYGNDWSKIIYDLYVDEFPDQQPLLMMRGGTTGLQKYAVFPWSTDVARSWAGLQPQINIMKHSGLSGLGYMGHDVGGFAIDPANPIDPELYVRWLQLGLFSPMLRTHAQQYAEPYHYPEYQDVTLDLIRQRYRWLPYNLNLAIENNRYGYPLVRPLNWANGFTDLYDDIDDEYLWGNDVLVAPVLTQGATSREVTFPQDAEWYDYNNPTKVYLGGTMTEVSAPIDVLPLYIRAGAFIPMADYTMQNVTEYRQNDYTVNYYPRANGLATTGYILEPDWQIDFTGISNGRAIDIEATSTATTDKNLTLQVFGVKGDHNAVAIDGVPTHCTYDEKMQKLIIPIIIKPNTTITISID